MQKGFPSSRAPDTFSVVELLLSQEGKVAVLCGLLHKFECACTYQNRLTVLEHSLYGNRDTLNLFIFSLARVFLTLTPSNKAYTLFLPP